MKKIIALVSAVIIAFGTPGAVFAQTVTRDFSYNIVVNGDAIPEANKKGINVDGSTMFTADSYASFPNTGLTADMVQASGKAFEFEGDKYYAVRDVANANNLNVFWDNATSTALIVNKDKYEQVKEYILASNQQSENAKRMEIEFVANAAAAMTIMGEQQSMALPFTGSMKFDLEAPYMEMKIKMSFMGQESSSEVYADGETMYTLDTSTGEPVWYKSESGLNDTLSMVEDLKALNFAVSGLAEDLSYAGLKLTESGEDVVLEGDMYISEIFNSMDFDNLMQEALNSADSADLGVSYDLPKIVHVKYVFDKDKNIKSMDMKFDMGFSAGTGEEAISADISLDLSIPTFIIDGEFSTTIPEEAVNNAVDLEEAMAEALKAAEEAAASEEAAAIEEAAATEEANGQ